MLNFQLVLHGNVLIPSDVNVPLNTTSCAFVSTATCASKKASTSCMANDVFTHPYDVANFVGKTSNMTDAEIMDVIC